MPLIQCDLDKFLPYSVEAHLVLLVRPKLRESNFKQNIFSCYLIN
jgi:hypothetical protein